MRRRPSAASPSRAWPPARTGAPALLPEGRSAGAARTAFWTAPTLAAPDARDRVNTSAAYGFVFDVCGLEVDPATGPACASTATSRATMPGRLLNPALADGQIRGAFAQGWARR